MNPGWSYILTAIGVFGLWLAGRKDWRGWLVGLTAQGVWLAYAVATQQWGFIVSAFAYGWVYALNIWLMRRRGCRTRTTRTSVSRTGTRTRSSAQRVSTLSSSGTRPIWRGMRRMSRRQTQTRPLSRRSLLVANLA